VDEMRGIILLEGSDCTGKTTLAKNLVERHGAHYIHLTYRFEDKMFTYHLAALHRAIKLSQKQLVIIDRLWLSECIYAHVFRGGTKWPEMGRMLDRILRRFGTIYVFCIGVNDEKYHDRFLKVKNQREEMYEDVRKVNTLYKQIYFGSSLLDKSDYSRLIGSTKGFCTRIDCEFYDINYHGSSISSFSDYIARRARENIEPLKKFHRVLDPAFYNLAGNVLQAKYLIVGDYENKSNRVVNYPFTEYYNPSLFLAECMTELSLVEDHFCYVNRWGEDGDKVIESIMSRRDCKVIYLGHDAIKGNTVSGHLLSDPRYNQREFKQQLLEALND
jgi:thymidylate kinase